MGARSKYTRPSLGWAQEESSGTTGLELCPGSEIEDRHANIRYQVHGYHRYFCSVTARRSDVLVQIPSRLLGEKLCRAPSNRVSKSWKDCAAPDDSRDGAAENWRIQDGTRLPYECNNSDSDHNSQHWRRLQIAIRIFSLPHRLLPDLTQGYRNTSEPSNHSLDHVKWESCMRIWFGSCLIDESYALPSQHVA